MRTLALRAAAFAAAASLAAPVAARRVMPPAPSAPRSVRFPVPVERTLKNGLRVVAVERKGVPLVASQVLVKSGAEVDPADLPGLAEMTAALLNKGTAKRSATQIAETVDSLGSSLEADARWDSSTAGVVVISSRVDPALEILADVVRNPTFKEEELERLRAQTLDDLNVTFSQPGALARFVAARVTFGDSAYGHPASGTPESVARIKRDDIVRLHSTYYRPDNAILVIGGDIKPEAAFAVAERLFGDWARPATPLPAPAAPAKAGDAKPRVVVVDKPDAGQAAVMISRPGIRRLDPEYFSGIVANSVLGGGYSSRLNLEVRIKRGLSYGAGSALDVRRDVGPFVESTQTKNESGAEVASLLVAELEKLGSTAIPAEELKPRKATLAGAFARSLETTEGLVARVADFALYGLSLDEANTYLASVEKVTAADVQKFAGTRIDSTGANVVVVGDAKQFLDALRKQFPSVEVIPEAELDFNNATLRKQSK